MKTAAFIIIVLNLLYRALFVAVPVAVILGLLALFGVI